MEITILDGYRGYFLGVKKLEPETDDSLFSAEVRNEWCCNSTPHTCVHDVYRNKFSLLD